MTIALVVKVFDGYVLASDSATTIAQQDDDGHIEVRNIYNNANKIFNLLKGAPISSMTWGQGNLGPASISTLTKELRRRFAGEAPGYTDWKLDPTNFQMDDVIARFREYFYDEHYVPACAGGTRPSLLGLLVAGYSTGATEPTIVQFDMTADGCVGPTEVLPDDAGATWWGQPEAITRVLLGVSGNLPQALINMGAPPDEAPALVQAIQNQVNEQLVGPAMPIQDAIDLAEFLVQLTIGYVRFSPGHPTVGGPIEIAAVTQHEGFSWVRRKHYFDSRLNPTSPGS